MEENDKELEVFVIDPLLDSNRKLIIYCIKGYDKNGVFEIFRTCEEFYVLRSYLL